MDISLPVWSQGETGGVEIVAEVIAKEKEPTPARWGNNGYVIIS